MTMTETKRKVQLTRGQIESIRQKANGNIRLILGKLGFQGADYGDRLVGCCPHEHDNGNTPNDNTSAFSWSFDRGIWRCFTNHCHEIYGSDIFALVMLVRGYEGADKFIKAVRWVFKALNMKTLDDIGEVSDAELVRERKVIQKKVELRHHQAIEEDMMRHLKPCDYLIKRGISEQTVEIFKANGSWHRFGSYGYNRLCVPIYDPINSYLIGFTCRTLLEDSELEAYEAQGSKIPKWLHCRNFGADFKKSSDREDNDRIHTAHILYNLNKAQHYMGELKTLILVEGVIDVLKFWDAGIYNVAAVFGTYVSKQQKMLLHQVGVERILICFDGDDAGNQASEKVVKLLGQYFSTRHIKIPDSKDPGDLLNHELRALVQRYTNDS